MTRKVHFDKWLLASSEIIDITFRQSIVWKIVRLTKFVGRRVCNTCILIHPNKTKDFFSVANDSPVLRIISNINHSSGHGP